MMAAAKKQQQHSKYKEINKCEKNASFFYDTQMNKA